MALTQAFIEAADAEAEFGCTAGVPWRRPETLQERLDVLHAWGLITLAEYETIRLRVLAFEAGATVPANSIPTPDANPCSPATKS